MGGKKKKPPKKFKQEWRRQDPSASTSAPPPPWAELPREITANILHRLGAIEILETAQRVCTAWREACKDPSMWREIDMQNHGDLHDMDYDLDIMCRHAVDRSQGQLVDINIEYFGTDDLIEFIAERAGQLKRLKVACCFGTCDEGLVTAVKEFPLLEELHLIFTEISNIEVVGHSCLLLKSFTLHRQGSHHPYVSDNEAFAIAKSMPGLHHLGLFGNHMTNEGLQAILDGCPRLESLDLRQCFNLDLSGEIGKRCVQQIKEVKRPYDSTEGCKWNTSVIDNYFDYISEDDECFLDYDDFTPWDLVDPDYRENFLGFY